MYGKQTIALDWQVLDKQGQNSLFLLTTYVPIDQNSLSVQFRPSEIIAIGIITHLNKSPSGQALPGIVKLSET